MKKQDMRKGMVVAWRYATNWTPEKAILTDTLPTDKGHVSIERHTTNGMKVLRVACRSVLCRWEDHELGVREHEEALRLKDEERQSANNIWFLQNRGVFQHIDNMFRECNLYQDTDDDYAAGRRTIDREKARDPQASWPNMEPGEFPGSLSMTWREVAMIAERFCAMEAAVQRLTRENLELRYATPQKLR